MKMKSLFTTALLVSSVVLVSCGEGKKEALKLETDKDKLSYAIGASSSESFANDQSGQAAKLDFALIAKGFRESLNDNDVEGCKETIQKLFGPTFMEFDSTYAKEGSECLGKLLANDFFVNMTEMQFIDRFNLEVLARGFEDGLYKADTIMTKAQKEEVLMAFSKDMQAYQMEQQQKQMAEMAKLDAPFLDEAKKRPNTKVLEGGIVLETIKAGNGTSPTMFDDVEAHYILTNAMGDTMESSIDMGKPIQINLQSVVKGWTLSFPQMKKGGKYRIFIPSELAYGQGALAFYIEFLNFGPAGTIAPARPQMGY